jgi:hypothetical protein
VACPTTPDAAQWQDKLYDRTTGEVLARQYTCVSPTEPAPPLPPLPPAPFEVWSKAAVPLPEVRINPHGDGLVGLSTWLWYDQATTQTLVVDAPPYWTVTVKVGVIGYRWDLGNGDTVTGREPGSELHPSAKYTYQHDCGCTVTATAIWGGSYTVSGPGFEPFTIDIGTREFTGPDHPFPVHEVQAVDRGPHG